MIDEKKLIEDVTKSWVLDTHVTDEASRVHSQEHRHLLHLIERQPKVGEWIPVEKALPKESGWYFVTLSDGTVELDQFFAGELNNFWRGFVGETYTVAWQPLPKPYEG